MLHQITEFELSGKTLGTIGLGNIGSIAADTFINGFGMKVLVYDPYIYDSQCAEHGLTKVENPEDLLNESDIINISVPLTDATENMIAKGQIDLMKKNAIIINATRGKIVNEVDLYDALKAGRIFGAAMDAFEVEPVKKDNPLLTCYNFIATSHNGANTVDSLIRMGTGAIDEIVRKKNGEDNHHVVV